MTIYEIELIYKKKNIDSSRVGFYDLPEFLTIENKNPSFLETYAQFVKEKEYSKEYIEKAELEIPFIVKILNEELKKDGKLGSCIDMSVALSRILEKEGYWNYLTKGSLTINFPDKFKISPKYFWSIDSGDFVTGHSWVVAPPFTLIDTTIRQQRYTQGEGLFIPDVICSKSLKTEPLKEIDIISPDVSNYLTSLGIISNKIETVKPGIGDFLKIFKPIIHIENNNVKYKYVTTDISAPDKPLEEIQTINLNGKIAHEIYSEIIVPKLKELRKTEHSRVS